MSQMRAIHRWLLTLFLLDVVVQFFLAGLGVFGTYDFRSHVANVHVMEILALLVLITAIVGRMGKRWILVSLSLPILVELQYVFANNGPSWFRALHVLNALAIAAIAGMATGKAWREAKGDGAEGEAPEEAPPATPSSH